jgi:hypothetical protein
MFADWNTYVSQGVSSSLGHCSPELRHGISVWLLYRLSAHFPYITFEKCNTYVCQKYQASVMVWSLCLVVDPQITNQIKF